MPLSVTCREIEPGLFESAAEISDFIFLKCRSHDRLTAIVNVSNFVAEKLLLGAQPVFTEYSLYGASLKKFPGFKITGEPLIIEPQNLKS